MSAKTEIAWTDSTWNPVRGCTKVSAGCKNCYAERFAERWRGVPGHPFEQGFDLRLVPEALDLPLHWRKPRRVFVNSMSDLFHEDVPDSFIDQVFAVMALAPQHTFQVLTKRPARMREFLGTGASVLYGRLNDAARHVSGRDGIAILPTQRHGMVPDRWPPPNVWLGVSVEDQAAADERIPHLLATPAAVRFLSCEPLLGPVDVSRWMWPLCWHWDGRFKSPEEARAAGAYAEQKPQALVAAGRPFIRWVIIGGESGPGARPCDVAWIRSLVKQCKAAHVPAFCKQLGANVQDRNDAGFDGDTPSSWPMDTAVEHDQADTGYQGAPVRVCLKDRKGADPAEWPAELRVRQMPEVAP